MKIPVLIGTTLVCAFFAQAQQDTNETHEFKVGDKTVAIDDSGNPIKEADTTKHLFDLKISDDNGKESSSIYFNDKEIFKAEENQDTVTVKVGKKTFKVVEDGNDTRITMEDENGNKKNLDSKSKKKDKDSKFNGHWSGVELGLNNFVDNNYQLSRKEEELYLDLNTSRSWAFNLNFGQHSIPLIGKRLGLVTGFGLGWNNYYFDNSNTIIKDSAGIITAALINPAPSKSKLTTWQIRTPLMLEYQFGSSHNSPYISAGVIGALKLTSKTKYITKNNGKDKYKNKDDFNINPFRYAFTARMGVDNVAIYATYYPTPFFEKNRGPELYPIEGGIIFSFD